ncbi:MAG: deoxyribose-phosphate aldolase [Eubacteriales bacterium]|nr:deoxyribose-phosphate aldolase [Eubacteriales bacterium]MDD4711516.1 deoxyribose-phosphate aldolase [Eubacteriales bacterium]
MTNAELPALVDHTLLKQTATWADIKTLCDEAMAYGTASVCIPPYFVKRAHDYVEGEVPICTVIGFPNGNTTTAVKVFEAREAIANGAVEIDMVINIGMLKAGEYGLILEEIKQLKAVAGDLILKVIIETCLLSDDEKIRMCGIVGEAGADFIKTSTGFSTGGATFDDIALFAKHVSPNVRIKASGGIATLDDARRFAELGAERLGTSRVVKLLQDKKTQGGY